MEHNVRYGRIWLEIFGTGRKWKMRGVASCSVDYATRPRPEQTSYD